MSPRISVVVIGYNIEKYISQCLESILAQDYKNFELIFVDDGSRDNTLQAAQKFSGDSRVRVRIIHKDNGGCVSARKSGVKAANGEYICFIDGDDFLNQDMLSNLVKELDSYNEQVDIVASRFFSQVKDGRFLELGGYEKYKSCRGYEFLELMITDKIFHSVFPKLYRREFVISSGYLDYPNISMGEDIMTNFLFGLHEPFVVFSQTVNYYYRYNVQSVTKKGGETCLEMLKSLIYIDEALESKFPGKYNSMMQYQWLLHMSSILYSHNISTEIKIKAINSVREKLQGFRENKYCFELWRGTRLAKKLIFTGYEKHPNLMYILDPLLRFL